MVTSLNANFLSACDIHLRAAACCCLQGEVALRTRVSQRGEWGLSDDDFTMTSARLLVSNMFFVFLAPIWGNDPL